MKRNKSHQCPQINSLSLIFHDNNRANNNTLLSIKTSKSKSKPAFNLQAQRSIKYKLNSICSVSELINPKDNPMPRLVEHILHQYGFFMRLLINHYNCMDIRIRSSMQKVVYKWCNNHVYTKGQ